MNYDNHARIANRCQRIRGYSLRPSAATEEPASYMPKGQVERCQDCGALCDARYVTFGVCRECKLMEVKP